MGLVKVPKVEEKSEDGGVVEQEQVAMGSARPEAYRLSKIGEPVTEEDIVFWKGRQARVPLYEELTLRLFMEIRDEIRGLYDKLEEVRKS